MDLPDGVATLLSDLERLGYVVEGEYYNAGRNATEIELCRPGREGITGVRLSQRGPRPLGDGRALSGRVNQRRCRCNSSIACRTSGFE
jgi:hypothetical protein